jgi:hypothetical protein
LFTGKVYSFARNRGGKTRAIWRWFGRAGLWLGKIAGALLALWGLWMIVVRT